MSKRVLWKAVLVGALAVTIGLAVLLCTVYVFDRHPTSGEWTKPTGELLESIGVSAIVFGIFNIIIGLPDWSRYFEERLQNIVLDSGYLKSLSPDQLHRLHRHLIKATFNSDKLDREGGFLDYFDRHLHRYLGQPYRERVRAALTYEDDGDFFFVHDMVTYVLRESSGPVMNHILWQNDPDEMDAVYSVRVAIRYPDGHARAGEQEVLRAIESEEATEKREILVDCILTDEQLVDRLMIEVESTYRVKKTRFHYWEMPWSTRNFSITINYPRSYGAEFKAFVHNPELTVSEEAPGRFHFECDSWMLPGSGIAWLIEAREPVLSLREHLDRKPFIPAMKIPNLAPAAPEAGNGAAPPLR